MTYLWLDGLPIEVKMDSDGQPQSLTWKSKKHPIHHVFNRWIFRDNWWSDAEHIWREYYFVITETRLIAVIFKDKVSGLWFIYRLFD